MTEGIIAALIGAAAAVMAAAIPHFAKSRAVKKPIQKKAAGEAPVAVETPALKSPAVETPGDTLSSVLTHKGIVDVIEAAPPFHQDAIKASFIGKAVEWHTRLRGMRVGAQDVAVFADIPVGSGSLICSARKTECEIFMLAAEGTPFVVKGKIRDVSRYDVELVDCSFRLVKEDPA